MSNYALLFLSTVALSVCILGSGDAWKDRDLGMFAIASLGCFLNGMAIGFRVAVILGLGS